MISQNYKTSFSRLKAERDSIVVVNFKLSLFLEFLKTAVKLAITNNAGLRYIYLVLHVFIKLRRSHDW